MIFQVSSKLKIFRALIWGRVRNLVLKLSTKKLNKIRVGPNLKKDNENQ